MARKPRQKPEPDKQIVLRPVGDLVPYINNPRTHSDEQVAVIAASIKEFGWTNPVLVDAKNGVIAGHGRVLAARKLGLDQVPCIELSHLTDAQRRAYVIADNQTALRAGWDPELLRLELEDLKGANFDLGLLGFDYDELQKLLADPGNAGLTDPDEIPEDVAAVAAKGDLWSLGKHRLMCGSATESLDVTHLLDIVEPHLMVTDPPYGVEYDPDWRNRALRANGKLYGGRAVGKVTNDDNAGWYEAYKLFPGDVAYVWHAAGANQIEFFHSLESAGFKVRMQIIWVKNQHVIGRGNYHFQHEPCWYAVRDEASDRWQPDSRYQIEHDLCWYGVRDKGTAHWEGDRKQSSVWSIDKPRKSETGHSTQKPVECMRRPIENNSSIGQAVYDPFMGSGTTIIAAEMTGRCAYGMEIEPKYVDVAIQRWENFTGKKAKKL